MNSYTYQQTGNQKKVVLLLLLGSFWLIGGSLFGLFYFGPESDLGLTLIGINAIVAIGFFIYYVRFHLLEKIEITLNENQFEVYYSKLDQRITFTYRDVKKIKMGTYDLAGISKKYLWIWMKNPRYDLFIENPKHSSSDQYNTFIAEFVSLLEVR